LTLFIHLLFGAAAFFAHELSIYDFDLKISKVTSSKHYGFVERSLKKPDKFFIGVCKGSDPFLTLAHELVHVKQYMFGELIDEPNGSTTWRTENFSQDTPYYERPWEWEALGRMQGLYQKWIKQ
jgi:hypothetical protein